MHPARVLRLSARQMNQRRGAGADNAAASSPWLYYRATHFFLSDAEKGRQAAAQEEMTAWRVGRMAFVILVHESRALLSNMPVLFIAALQAACARARRPTAVEALRQPSRE